MGRAARGAVTGTMRESEVAGGTGTVRESEVAGGTKGEEEEEEEGSNLVVTALERVPPHEKSGRVAGGPVWLEERVAAKVGSLLVREVDDGDGTGTESKAEAGRAEGSAVLGATPGRGDAVCDRDGDVDAAEEIVAEESRGTVP